MDELPVRLKMFIDKEMEYLVDKIIVNRIGRYSTHEAVKAAEYMAYKFDELRKERIDILGDFSTQYNDRPIRNIEMRDDPYLKSLIDYIIEPIKERRSLLSKLRRKN